MYHTTVKTFFRATCLALALAMAFASMQGCAQKTTSPVDQPAPQTQQTQLPPPEYSNWATVTASALNVRSGPSTSYAIIDRLTNGEAVEVLSRDGDWTHIRFKSNLQGYVHGNYLRLNQQTSTTTQTPAYNPYGTANDPYASTSTDPYASSMADTSQDKAVITDLLHRRVAAFNEHNEPLQLSLFYSQGYNSTLLQQDQDLAARQVTMSNLRALNILVNGDQATVTCVVTMNGYSKSAGSTRFKRDYTLNYQLVRRGNTWKITQEQHSDL